MVTTPFVYKQDYTLGGYDYDTELEAGINRFGWKHQGDGYHNTTRYGENELDEARKASLGVVYRNWVSLLLYCCYISYHNALDSNLRRKS